MKRIAHFLLSQFSFAVIIFLEIISKGVQGDPEKLFPFMTVSVIVLAVNMVLLIKNKHGDYFPIAIFFIVLTGFSGYFVNPAFTEWFLHHIITGLYIALFFSAALPPILGFNPFTYLYSAYRYPVAIVRSSQFKKVNLIINWIWAFLFLTCVYLSSAHLSDDAGNQFYVSVMLPIVIQLAIGVPSIVFIPRISGLRTRGSRLRFESNREMFEAMPLGLNPKKAGDMDAIFQFCLNGKEPVNGYLKIKNKKCSYTQGITDKATVKVMADSDLWLDISNGKISGQKALMDGRYSVDGDISCLEKFDELFSPEEPSNPVFAHLKKIFKKQDKKKFQYQTRMPGEIKKILLVDGSTRSKKFGKSMFMAGKFAEGAKSAGAQVETITVRKYSVNGCTGCFHCFSKTPGVCSQNDDMSGLIVKIKESDLIVFVTPLYFFSVSSQIKVFIDRMLPLMEPFMEIQNDIITHPMRQKNRKSIPLVVFSAGGFPDVEENFDGISGMFRALHRHNDAAGGGLMAEFYLPAAEMIVQPAYRVRKEKVARACHDAGVQIIKEGKIDPRLMQEVSDLDLRKETFQTQANNYWEMLQGQPYQKLTPGID